MDKPWDYYCRIPGAVPERKDDVNDNRAVNLSWSGEFDSDQKYWVDVPSHTIEIEGPLMRERLFRTNEPGDELTLTFQLSNKWYSRKYECDVVIADITPDKDGASFEGKKWRDVSNKSWLARFIRWVLKL